MEDELDNFFPHRLFCDRKFLWLTKCCIEGFGNLKILGNRFFHMTKFSEVYFGTWDGSTKVVGGYDGGNIIIMIAENFAHNNFNLAGRCIFKNDNRLRKQYSTRVCILFKRNTHRER